VLKLIVIAHRVLPVNDWRMTQVTDRQNLHRQVRSVTAVRKDWVGIVSIYTLPDKIL